MTEQKKDWLAKHPKATVDDAWEAGYWQATENWCKKTK